MNTRMAVLVSLCLGGCVVLPAAPLYSAWYMHHSSAGDTMQPPKLYVTLLNRGTRAIEVKDVILNRSEGENSLDLRLKADPKTLPSGKDGKLVLYPGRLTVIPCERFEWVVKSKEGKRTPKEFNAKCILPVEVAIVPLSEQHWLEQWVNWLQGEPDGMIRAEMVGRMPSSLPDGWDSKCEPQLRMSD